MTVARILRGKDKEILTTTPTQTLSEAATLLARRKIGALVATDETGRVLGIISERDIVRAIAAHGPAALESPVSAYMTSKVITTTEDAQITSTMQIMSTGRFRHLPVVHDGKLIGVISIGDVVKSHIEAIENEYKALRDYIHTA